MTSNEIKNAYIQKLIKKIDNNPDKSQNYYDLAIILIKENNLDQAEELLLKALHLVNEKDINLIYYGLGNLYYTSADYDRSLYYFEKISDENLKDNSILMISQSYYALGKYEKSLAFALKIVDLDFSNYDGNVLIADAFLALGIFKEAVKYYERALNSKNDDAKVWFNRGLVEMIINQDKGFDNYYFMKSRKINELIFNKCKDRLVSIDKFRGDYRK